jgi:hypothetical protein
MGVGLLAGAWAAGYGTSVGELALMGAITGLPLGAAQGFLLRDRVARSWVWAAAMPLLWALGWTVTAAAGIDVDRQYAVFGAFGAITFMALSGVVLDRLRAAPHPHHPRSTARPPRPPSCDELRRVTGWLLVASAAGPGPGRRPGHLPHQPGIVARRTPEGAMEDQPARPQGGPTSRSRRAPPWMHRRHRRPPL